MSNHEKLYFNHLRHTIKTEQPKTITTRSLEELGQRIRCDIQKNGQMIHDSLIATQHRKIG